MRRVVFLRIHESCGCAFRPMRLPQNLFFLTFLIIVALLAGCKIRPEGDARGGAVVARNDAPLPAPVRIDVAWPTPNTAYLQGREFEAFVQSTASGETTSGLFGSVRSQGLQFHEGLDLFPLTRDRSGEATDPVFAALAGVVRHVSTREGASSYGRYIVLEHPGMSPAVYTLYAHLAAVVPGVVPGVEVAVGATLGQMGRSAGGYTIPKDRAHLHFEIGLRMTDEFQAWYIRRGFGNRNEHGLYNGMNLMGIDPLELFARHRAGGVSSLDEVFSALPTAIKLRIANPVEPDFLRRYPSLISRHPTAELALGGGWEIDISPTGVPIRWRRLGTSEIVGWKLDEVRIVATDRALLAGNRGRKLVEIRKGVEVPGPDLRTVLELLFGVK